MSSSDPDTSSGSNSGSSDSSSSLENESELLLRPVFLRKKKTAPHNENATPTKLAIARAEHHQKIESNNAEIQDFDGVEDTDDVDPEKEYALWKERERFRRERDRQKLADFEREKEDAVRRQMRGDDKEASGEESDEKNGTLARKSAHLGSYYAENIDESLLKRDYTNIEDLGDHSRPTKYKRG